MCDSLHCLQKPKFSVRSDGKFFRVTFRSNDRLDGTGFRAAYEFETVQSTTDSQSSMGAKTVNGRQQRPSGGGAGKAGTIGSGASTCSGWTATAVMAAGMVLVFYINQLSDVQL